MCSHLLPDADARLVFEAEEEVGSDCVGDVKVIAVGGERAGVVIPVVGAGEAGGDLEVVAGENVGPGDDGSWAGLNDVQAGSVRHGEHYDLEGASVGVSGGVIGDGGDGVRAKG